MQDIIMTPATIAVLGLLAAWAVWAVRRMSKRGLCDCGDHCGGGCEGCASRGHASSDHADGACANCPAAGKMLADAEKSLQ